MSRVRSNPKGMRGKHRIVIDGVALTMNRSAVRRGRARIMEEKAFEHK